MAAAVRRVSEHLFRGGNPLMTGAADKGPEFRVVPVRGKLRYRHDRRVHRWAIV